MVILNSILVWLLLYDIHTLEFAVHLLRVLTLTIISVGSTRSAANSKLISIIIQLIILISILILEDCLICGMLCQSSILINHSLLSNINSNYICGINSWIILTQPIHACTFHLIYPCTRCSQIPGTPKFDIL